MFSQHPDYDDGSGGFVPQDVCVLQASGSISGSGVDLDSSESGSDCWISGWGVDTSKCLILEHVCKTITVTSG